MSAFQPTLAKAQSFNRILAKGIDLLIFGLIASVLPSFIGPVLGFAYTVLGDGLRIGRLRGQSLGKHLFSLQVIHTGADQRPANFKDSLVRNLPVGVVTFFAIFPPWGWILLVLVGAPLTLMEVYLMTRSHDGLRLGDVMADTEVRQLQEGDPGYEKISFRDVTRGSARTALKIKSQLKRVKKAQGRAEQESPSSTGKRKSKKDSQ